MSSPAAASITVTFADGTTTIGERSSSANPKLDVATLNPAKLPQVVVPATLGGGARGGGVRSSRSAIRSA